MLLERSCRIRYNGTLICTVIVFLYQVFLAFTRARGVSVSTLLLLALVDALDGTECARAVMVLGV